MINGFADDHSFRRTYKVTDKENRTQNKNSLQATFQNIQKWMDTMWVTLNSDKTECTQFLSTKHIEKLDTSSFNANGNLIKLSIVVRYLGGYLNRSLTFKDHIKEKKQKTNGQHHKNKVNMKIPHSRFSHNFTAHALHFTWSRQI